jgi:mannose-6-phosphate isomerase-like protein (cupin superfamily)
MEVSTQPICTMTTDQRNRLWVMGAPLEIIVTGEQTGGAYAVVEDRSLPGFGPPPHVHHREDEAFYVIEGEYLFGSDDGEIRVGPGGFVHAPKGRLHWWRNVGQGRGRHVEIFVPGGLEKMFEEIGEPMKNIDDQPPAPDPARLLAAAPRYGVEFKV